MTDEQYDVMTSQFERIFKLISDANKRHDKMVKRLDMHMLENAQAHAAMLDAFSAPFIRVEDEVQCLTKIENRRTKLLSKFLKKFIKKHPA